MVVCGKGVGVDWLEGEMEAVGNREVGDYGLAGVFLILGLSGRTDIAEQLIRIPEWFVGWTDADIGALSAGLANEGSIVVFGVLRAGLALHRCVVVERSLGGTIDGKTLTGLQVVVLSNGARLDGGLAYALVLVPLSVCRALLALFGSGIPVGRSLIAFLAVERVGVPEGCLGRTHADLSGRAVIVALLGG